MGLLAPSKISIADPLIKNGFARLEKEGLSLSCGEYDYRYHLLPNKDVEALHLVKNDNVLNFRFEGKYLAYAHFIFLDGNVYFSERATHNAQVKGSKVIEIVYNELISDPIFDRGRRAKLILPGEIEFVVEEILNAYADDSFLEILFKDVK